MKRRVMALGGLIALLGTTATVGVLAQNPPSPVPNPHLRGRLHRERHPELRRALRTLQRARMDLQHAARDFGGHRAKAEALVEQAIQETQQAIRYDKQ